MEDTGHEIMKSLTINSINPKKLLYSKWTAVSPKNKEKHFIIIEVDYDDLGLVVSCIMEAIISKRQSNIEWRNLKDKNYWKQGWNI